MIAEHDLRCSGCAACMAACPEHAITMRPDEEGFLFPVIDRKKCTDCGVCDSVCQIHHTRKNAWRDHCYAARNANEEAVAFSSSGAIFPMLADYVLAQGGYVFGCVIDDDFTVRHMGTQSTKDVRRMCKSKYVQSDMGDCLQQVKNLLDAQEFVFFTGTPCQVSGLVAFLDKDYDNLLTMDMLCHGVPSPQLLKRYIADAATHHEISEIQFRDKVEGWNKSVRMTWLDRGGHYLQSLWHSDDPYMRAFALNHSLRHSCGTCRYATPQRASDITVCDFWCIDNVLPSINDNKGISGLMVNTDKGERVVQDLWDHFSVLTRVPFASLVGNGPLIHPSRMATDRDSFYKILHNEGDFMRTMKNAMHPVGILNFFACDNYGSFLCGIALVTAIRRMGYRPELINFYGKKLPGSKLQEFRDTLPMTLPVFTYEDCAQLNNRYTHIVTGSDVVFSDFNVEAEIGMLAWAHGRKTLISWAASFGEKNLTGAVTEEVASLMLRRFDAISVREDSAVDLCERLGVRAKHLVDAAMLLTPEDYAKIITQDKKLQTSDDDYVATYLVLQPYESLMKLLNSVIPGKQVNIGYGKGMTKYSIGQFLDYIRRASFVVTDSFHGTLLSILFNKNFIVLKPTLHNPRLESLLRMFGVKKTIHDIHDVSPETLAQEPQPDYKLVNERIRERREEALNWLREALAIQPSEKPEFIASLVKERGLDRPENREKLYAWADEQSFDSSCGSPNKTPFTLAVRHALARVYSPRIPDEDANITAARDLAYCLQLAEAHSVLDQQSFALIEADTVYRDNPHLLADVIAQFKRDTHLQYLLREAERLKGQPVYFFGCTRMYRLRRYLFRESCPRAILVDLGSTGHVCDGLCVRNIADIRPEEALPVIIFSDRAATVARRIRELYPFFSDIVCCAMY
ncbi:MAG: polysaccharide pyruvyl transferase family protein [Desulfovibrionaceae bacterium]|nr:polysaccharide pyruvyl transferase family protein [Desulfovibrionaceae bacterium]